MVFLSVMMLTFSLAAWRSATEWSRQAERALTIQIDGPVETRAERAASALRVLATTADSGTAKTLDQAAQRALLEPWIGATDLSSILNLPTLIAVSDPGPDFDIENLRLRLAAEVPDSSLTDHATWRSSLLTATGRLSWLGLVSSLLALGTMLLMSILAARSAMLEHRSVVATLRLLGARDRFIARAFVMRITRWAAIGAIAGAGIAALILILSPNAPEAGVLFGDVGFRGAEWLLPAAVAALAVLAAFVATLWTARAVLHRMP